MMNHNRKLSLRQFVRPAVWATVLVLVSATLGVALAWRAPGLDVYARDVLLRWRGPVAPPSEVVIVAIDEASLARFGRFPWPRGLMAQLLDRLAVSPPRVIALDVLYSEPTVEDQALAQSIARVGNVILAAQLTQGSDGRGEWLRPVPVLARAAAGVGHVNVFTGEDGVARALVLRQTNHDAQGYWALAVETLRVAEGGEAREAANAVWLGARRVPLQRTAPPITADGAESLQAAVLPLDYVGPAGAFAAQTLSFADVLDGRVAPEAWRGKLVLVGATATALGDRIASPFTQTRGAPLLPGVEVLANALHTLLSARFYRPLSDAGVFGWTCVAALLMCAALSLAQGRGEAWKSLAALLGLFALALGGAYLAYVRWLIWPPLVPLLTACLAAALLTLLWRALQVSARLDAQIAALMHEETASPGEPGALSQPFRQTRWWPRGSAWKARALGELSRRRAARARFVERAFNSVEDGLLIADAAGRILFANPRAALWLAGAEGDLFACLDAVGDAPVRREEVARQPVEREVMLGAQRHCLLRVAAVRDDATLHGFVATLADITRQHELQQSRNDVMALVSHELRTPLTAIQAMSGVLAKHDFDAARRRELHAAINEETRRLARMIEDYLDITRLESGARPLQLAPVSVAALLEQTLRLLEPLAGQRAVTLVRQIATPLLPLVADADLLARAVTNLVANAIKFSPAQGVVTVKARVEGGALLIEVSDQGCGIPAEALERIFEKFYRVPRTEDTETPGTGLGLAFVREIAELHGGRVTVESVLGEGSRFTIWLPQET